VGWFENGEYHDANALTGLRDSVVQVIHQTRDGALWFGAKTGLLRFDGMGSRLFKTQDGLAADEVTDLLETRGGDLWVATSGGITRLGSGGGFTSYTERDGLSSNRTRTLHEDADGALWIGTYDGGLTRLRAGQFTRYTTADGLFSNGVFRILEDARGNFWMSSNRGIFRVARQGLNDFADGKIRALTSVSYGKDDGLISTECNGGKQPAGVRTRDGKLWFPTQGGVAVIDPQTVPHNPLAPPVHIEESLVDTEPAAPGDGVVRIAPGKDNLEIRYTGLSFIKPEEIKFRYRMEGLDREWVEAGSRRVAYYSYLPPGEYTFTVIAANSDGVWNEAGATVRVVVVPPFYRTWWFFALAALGVAAAAVLVYERRVSHLKRAQAAQAAFSRQLIASQEGERKRIAAELHDSIGQSLAIIKNRAALSLSQPADHERALDQLDEISDAATHAIEEVREIAYNLRPLQLDQLGLKMALESMLRKADDAAGGLRVAYDIDRVDGLLTPEQEINLYRIVQEGLGNIIKHAEATEARVSLKLLDHALDLAIQDNGRGFAGGEASRAGGARIGFGLLDINERAHILGGRPSIQSAPGQGTTISVRIDLKSEANGNHGH